LFFQTKILECFEGIFHLHKKGEKKKTIGEVNMHLCNHVYGALAFMADCLAPSSDSFSFLCKPFVTFF